MATFTAIADGLWSAQSTWNSTYELTGLNQGLKTFIVDQDVSAIFTNGTILTVFGSTGNDGDYAVVSSSFTTSTAIIVTEVIPSAVVDGDIILNAVPQDGDEIVIDAFDVQVDVEVTPLTITAGFNLTGGDRGSITMVTGGFLNLPTIDFQVYNGMTLVNFTDDNIVNAGLTMKAASGKSELEIEFTDSLLGGTLLLESGGGTTTYLRFIDSEVNAIGIAGGTKWVYDAVIGVITDESTDTLNLVGCQVATMTLSDTPVLQTESTVFTTGGEISLTTCTWTATGSPELGTQDIINANMLLDGVTLGPGGYWFLNGNTNTVNNPCTLGNAGSSFYLRGYVSLNVSGDVAYGNWNVWGTLHLESGGSAMSGTVSLMSPQAVYEQNGGVNVTYDGPSGINNIIGIGI